MSTWVCVGIAATLGACGGRTQTERERALERIPAQAQLILAADGTALATPAFRIVLDSLTPHVPPSLACVVEVARTSEAIAAGMQLDVGTTIVVVTRAEPTRCPALSKVAEHMWAATIGAGVLAPDRPHSMLDGTTWERARPYLLREPFALAAELPQLRLVAVAQPDPVDAWLAIDASDAASVERTIKTVLDRWRTPTTIDLSGKLTLARKGTQVAVQATKLDAENLVRIVTDTLTAAEARHASTMTSPFTCPSPGAGVVSCHDDTKFTVTSVASVLSSLGKVESAPVIAGGDIIGIRLVGEPPLLLRKGDVILGVDAQRITESKQLLALATRGAGEHAAIAVRRDGVEAVIELRE